MTASPWNPETLAALAAALEVDVTPFAADGSPRARRTIWSIGVGDELYVRSWKGPTAVWYRDAIASHQGSIEVTGGGRIWYLLDPSRRIVWITEAGTGHPKTTD